MQEDLRKTRPIAKGLLSKRTALFSVLFLFITSLLIGIIISFPVFLCVLVLIVSQVLYTLPPFRFKEIAFLDMLLNSINVSCRFLAGFLASGGSIFIIPLYFLGFTVSLKAFLFLGHRWQARSQDKKYHFPSTVSFLTPKLFGFVSFFLLGLCAVFYAVSIFTYHAPVSLLFYPILVGILLAPLLPSLKKGVLEKQEKNERFRNYLYFVILIFAVALFLSTQHR